MLVNYEWKRRLGPLFFVGNLFDSQLQKMFLLAGVFLLLL